jgi:hypothetical protein
VCFSVLVFRFAPEQEQIWDWFIQATAVFIGALLALAIGVGQFGYQQREIADTRREEFRALVRAELEETVQRLQGSGATAREPTALDHVKPLALEEAVRSGLLPPSFSKELMSVARQFYIYNNKVFDTLAIPGRYDLNSQPGWQRLRGAQKGLADQAEYIIELCQELLNHAELAEAESISEKQ